MTIAARPSVVEKWLAVVFLVVGSAFLGVSAYSHLHGTTPENQLTHVVGEAREIQVSESSGIFYLKFAVGKYRTEYSSKEAKYQEILAAVQSGKLIEVWISTKQETVFPRSGWVPLYKLNLNGNPVLTYQDVIGEKTVTHQGVLIFAIVVFGLGVWGCWLSYRRHRRYREFVADYGKPLLPMQDQKHDKIPSAVAEEPLPPEVPEPFFERWRVKGVLCPFCNLESLRKQGVPSFLDGKTPFLCMRCNRKIAPQRNPLVLSVVLGLALVVTLACAILFYVFVLHRLITNQVLDIGMRGILVLPAGFSFGVIAIVVLVREWRKPRAVSAREKV